MAETGRLTLRTAAPYRLNPVTTLRIAIIVAVLAAWEALAASGLLYRDVVPSLFAIGKALFTLLVDPNQVLRTELGVGSYRVPLEISYPDRWPEFYWHLYTTFYEIAVGMVFGGLSGLVVGIALGGSRLLRRAYEPMLYYLGPCPKIIFFPVMIMWFGVGPGSKVAMGAISCFFPVALNVAGGMREIDQVLIRVGKSFRANTWQMVTKIYLPAMRHPIINGIRLGLGVCLIGTLLAETKLSNRGIGFLVIQAYSLFNMPLMYALLIVLFVIAIGANALIGRFGGLDDIKRS
jgi:ABC-type nitrate/sulfonate/bicarbonate transport system permease component